MEDLDVTRKISLEQIATESRRAEVGFPAAGGVVMRLRARAQKSAGVGLICWLGLVFSMNPARALTENAHWSRSPDERPDRAGDRGGIIEVCGLALAVTGLSPYLPQGIPLGQRQPDENGCLQGGGGHRQAGEQRRFLFDLEFLAGLLIGGLGCWGSAAWAGRR